MLNMQTEDLFIANTAATRTHPMQCQVFSSTTFSPGDTWSQLDLGSGCGLGVVGLNPVYPRAHAQRGVCSSLFPAPPPARMSRHVLSNKYTQTYIHIFKNQNQKNPNIFSSIIKKLKHAPHLAHTRPGPLPSTQDGNEYSKNKTHSHRKPFT